MHDTIFYNIFTFYQAYFSNFLTQSLFIWSLVFATILTAERQNLSENTKRMLSYLFNDASTLPIVVTLRYNPLQGTSNLSASVLIPSSISSLSLTPNSYALLYSPTSDLQNPESLNVALIGRLRNQNVPNYIVKYQKTDDLLPLTNSTLGPNELILIPRS